MNQDFNAWRFTALSPLPLWALLALGLAAVATVGLAWRGLRAEPKPGRRAALLALRAASALLAVALLLEPGVELLHTARVRNRFALLVDTSRSMGFPVGPGGPSRALAAGALLSDHRGELSKLSERVDVEVYGFSGEIRGGPLRGGASRAPGHRRKDRFFWVPWRR